MARYKLIIEYNGTHYHGWQRQRNVWTIQEALEKAAYQFSGECISIHGASRTDSGVHAYGQVAHADFSKVYQEETVVQAINFYLKKESIRVLSAQRVADSFHARFSSIKRTYHYYILNRKIFSPLYKNLVWHVPYVLDVKKMQNESQSFEGRHDFSFFRSAGCQARNAIRTINSCKVLQESQDRIRFVIIARSFLYHQVCNMVGALVMIGSRQTTYNISNLLLRNSRSSVPIIVAPSHGLYLVSCEY